MKKLYLLFGFALMGVLFVACQKDEPVVEEIPVDSNEMVSVERTDCSPCVTPGNCCCRLINLNQTGRQIDLCPQNYISPPPQPGLNLYNWTRYSWPTSSLFPCQIRMNDCDPTFAGDVVIGWHLETIDGWSPLTDAADHFYFPHHNTISFCHAPAGYIRVCNPEPNPAEWHLVCGLDVHPYQWETFFLLPSECRLFRVDSNCDVEECEEV